MYKKLSANPLLSKGRLLNESLTDTLRTPFERDRDRVIHSNAFRKLKDKTQVFMESDSDYYRTRLTHTLEVAQISRSLCRALNLNEDLGEVVSLAHDLGHPPFGHNGEEALNHCMEKYGGFNHNDQTIRIITYIEKRYPEFDGLNLTWESLEGILKHNGPLNKNLHFHTKNLTDLYDLKINLIPHLESQIAAIADDIAYNNHDVEDGLRAKLLDIDSLNEIEFFCEIIKEIKFLYPNISLNILVYQMRRNSISKMINDIIDSTNKNIKKLEIQTLEDVFLQNKFIVKMSNKMNNNCKIIREYLYSNLYNHKNLMEKRNKAENIMIKLFKYYSLNFNKLPSDWIKLKKNEAKERIICDYISGMTDRFAKKLYINIYE